MSFQLTPGSNTVASLCWAARRSLRTRFCVPSESDAQSYRLHGLTLRSELPLCASFDDRGFPDYIVKWADGTRTDGARRGRVVARAVLPAGEFEHASCETGYQLRFPGVGEFLVDVHEQSITVCLIGGVHPDIASLLLAGHVMAFLLNVAGECVLHASGVLVDESVLAFAGASGSGKSTLAALFCSDGARLVSDDVLRLRFDADG